MSSPASGSSSSPVNRNQGLSGTPEEGVRSKWGSRNVSNETGASAKNVSNETGASAKNVSKQKSGSTENVSNQKGGIEKVPGHLTPSSSPTPPPGNEPINRRVTVEARTYGQLPNSTQALTYGQLPNKPTSEYGHLPGKPPVNKDVYELNYSPLTPPSTLQYSHMPKGPLQPRQQSGGYAGIPATAESTSPSTPQPPIPPKKPDVPVASAGSDAPAPIKPFVRPIGPPPPVPPKRSGSLAPASKESLASDQTSNASGRPNRPPPSIPFASLLKSAKKMRDEYGSQQNSKKLEELRTEIKKLESAMKREKTILSPEQKKIVDEITHFYATESIRITLERRKKTF